MGSLLINSALKKPSNTLTMSHPVIKGGSVLLFMLLFLSPKAYADPNAARLNESLSGLIIENAWHLPDPGAGLSAEDLTQGQRDDAFSSIKDFGFTLDPDVRNHWVRLIVRNSLDENRTWVLNLENWTLAELYALQEGKTVVKRSGHFTPYNDRDYRAANHVLLPLALEAGESTTVYLRLQSSINFLQVPSNLQFSVVHEAEFRRTEMGRRFALGLFAGFYIIMLLYNLFIYISTRDRNYIPYLLALLAAVALTFHNLGYTVSIFYEWESYVHVHSKMQFFLSQVLGISMLVFAAWFLEVKKRYPRLYTVIKILIIAILFLPIPSLLGYASVNEKISGLLGITTMAFILTIAIKSYRDRFPSSGLFLIGYGAFAAGIVVILCTFIGILPVTVQNYFPMNIGSTIEMVFFSLALGNRINILAKDNEEKQAQIINQLKEREELQANINRDLETKVKERTREIDHQKVLIEGEKEKVDNLLKNILPVLVANELKEKGEATPQAYKKVSVLFADLIGFTGRAEQMQVTTVISELDYCFQAFDDIVDQFGLEKIKTIGDGYMCAGGVPIPSDDNPIRAVGAALAMQEFIEEWGKRRVEAGEEPWQIRIGIHTGEVIAGVVGKRKFAYDIWGDTVNTASRIESACEPTKVNVSGATYEIVKDRVEAIYRGRIMVKDKNVDMYYIEAVKS